MSMNYSFIFPCIHLSTLFLRFVLCSCLLQQPASCLELRALKLLMFSRLPSNTSQVDRLIPKMMLVCFSLYFIRSDESSFLPKFCSQNSLCFDCQAEDNTSTNNAPKDDSSSGKTDKGEEVAKERPSKKGKKKEREPADKPSVKSKILKKRALVLPLEASIVALLLLIMLGAFYVVCRLSSSYQF